MSDENRNENDEPIFQDKRRIDPVTGEVRGSAAAASGADSPAPEGGRHAGASEGAVMGEPETIDEHTVSDEELERLIADARAADDAGQTEIDVDAPGEPSADAARAAEAIADLQRVSAEYANYRRRTEQEKLAARDANTAEVLRGLLPVLDDLDRAEQHGDLPEDGALTVIAHKLRGSLEKLGLTAYGEKGEAFDPTVHEAIAQLPTAEVETETVADVVERGYRVGERIVRVAKVAVFVPAN